MCYCFIYLCFFISIIVFIKQHIFVYFLYLCVRFLLLLVYLLVIVFISVLFYMILYCVIMFLLILWFIVFSLCCLNILYFIFHLLHFFSCD